VAQPDKVKAAAVMRETAALALPSVFTDNKGADDEADWHFVR
jgi:hypothetical protein